MYDPQKNLSEQKINEKNRNIEFVKIHRKTDKAKLIQETLEELNSASLPYN